MDLGIKGKTALVCGASKGLGRGCAEALLAEGVDVTVVARTAADLDIMAGEIAAAALPGSGKLTTVACDITTPEGRRLALDACGQPDILVTNAGGPPTGDFRDWDRDRWIAALDANMLTPIELIKATVDGMMERGFGRIVNITSSAVKAPIDVLGLSNGARSGLTGFVAGVARKTVERNVTINNLLPGPFDTARLAANAATAAAAQGKPVGEIMESRRLANPARRFGTPAEFGAFCAFICSTSAGYLTGQNILLDGGAYPGTF
jgi:3-oxoacyl-[acyl-carrier protein] reductase